MKGGAGGVLMSGQVITVRKADQRGAADHGWLQSRFSFSFADYYDPEHMGFRALRVINDDIIAPAKGFGMHPHRDVEILSYVVSGALEHNDSMGYGAVIKRGDVQLMSAGVGIHHSEANPSRTESMRLIQIWIEPEVKGLVPSYEYTRIDDGAKQNRLALIVSRDGRGGSATINQDVDIYATILAPGAAVTHRVRDGRHVWVQLVDGEVTVNGTAVGKGDGIAIENAAVISIDAASPAEFLLFDLR